MYYLDNKTALLEQQLEELKKQINSDAQKNQTTRDEMTADISTGKKFGQEVLGGGLGRLGTSASIKDIRAQLAQQAKDRSDAVAMSPSIQTSDIALQRQSLDPLQRIREAQLAQVNVGKVGNLDTIQRGVEDRFVQNAYDQMQNIASRGLSRQELQAEREALTSQLQRAQQTAARTTMAQQGAAGVQGAVAGRQLMDINSQAASQRANIARDLFLKSEQIKREGAGNVANLALQRQGMADARNQAFQQLNLQRGSTLLQAQQNRDITQAQMDAARSLNLAQMGQSKDLATMQASQQRSQALANLEATRQLNQAGLNIQRTTTNEAMRQTRLGAAETALANRLSAETAIQTFDLGQAAKEKTTLLQAGLGFAALGSAERGSEKAAQASAQSAAAQSSGGKIICTELHRQGLLSDEIMALDAAYGVKLRAERPHVYDGYVLWAKYVVLGMKKSKTFTFFVGKIATPWAENMAYNNNTLGKVLGFLGEGICGIIGRVVGPTKFKMSDLFEV
jgi:hypothetical protein